ncbi:MAG: hypothetical protein ACYTAS_21470 [Planctomycetota bacterium]|jgi:hypothetical protein
METHKKRSTPSATILLAAAALLGAMVLYQVAGFFMTTARAELAVARAAEAGAAERNDLEQRLAQVRSAAEALKKNNLFAPTPAKQNPVKEVTGILGSEALINGTWHKAGAKVGDATIVTVGPTKVKVLWDGKETEFAPIVSGASGGPGGPPGARPSRGPRPGPPRPGPTGQGGPRPKEGPGGLGDLSPQELAELKERFRNASPEEQQKLREEMRERSGRSRR